MGLPSELPIPTMIARLLIDTVKRCPHISAYPVSATPRLDIFFQQLTHPVAFSHFFPFCNPPTPHNKESPIRPPT